MIGPYEFPLKLVWTNGAQSSLKVSVLTGIGPYSALPCEVAIASEVTNSVRISLAVTDVLTKKTQLVNYCETPCCQDRQRGLLARQSFT